MKKMIFLMAVTALVATALLSACSPQGGPVVSPTSPPSPAATRPAMPEPSSTSPEPIPAANTPLPQTEDPGAIHPLSGLTLATGSALWQVDGQGELREVVQGWRPRLSTDGSQVLYTLDDPTSGVSDIWVTDLQSGEARNLTQTPDRFEQNPSWWPGHPEMVFFTSDVEPGMASRELPTSVRLDGSEYSVLDPEMGGPYAIAPDGSVLYGGYTGTARIYRPGGEIEIFNPSDYGVPAEALFSPAWSPDGSRIAAVLRGQPAAGGENRLGVGVFDLSAKTGELYHVYTPQGGGEFDFGLAWDPSGQWLAFSTFNEPLGTGEHANLWVIHPDGTGEQHLGPGLNPVWSPDGSRLAFMKPNETGFTDPWWAETGTWTAQAGDLPSPPEPGLFLMDWVAP